MAYCGTDIAVRLARRLAAAPVKLERVARPVASRDGTGTHSKVAMVPDEDSYSEV